VVEYRRLGQQGPTVAAIGVGCWVMGGRGYGPADDDEMVRVVDHALAAGATLFDTAPAYGNGYGEILLGRALGRRRHEAFIVTKGGLVLEGGSIVRRDSSAAVLQAGLNDSLQRLATDYVDLFLIHWPDRERSIAEAMDGLREIHTSGKARYVGVSNFAASDLRAAAAGAPIVVNQIGYNLFDRRWEHEMFPTARALGIGIMAYSPLCHGLLSGHYRPGHRFTPNDWRARGQTLVSQELFLPEHFDRNIAVVDRLKPIAAGLGTTVAALAIAWTLRDPLVAAAIIGPRRVDQLDESLAGCGLTIPSAALAEIDAVMADATGLVAELPR
jgi:aryl-alcohol dehydrogenase-like predicted oxidoreductase